MRQVQFSRHWILLQQVINARYGRRIDELARELNCTERTVRRYLEGLQGCGIPIHTEKSSRGTVWKLDGNFRNMPAPPFSVLDALAIILARKALVARGEQFGAEQLGSLLQRLNQGRPPEFRKKLTELENSVYATGVAKDITAHLAAVYGDISDAIANHHKLCVSYRNSSGKLSTSRKLAPLHIWIVGQQSYLIAFCYQAGEVRTFSIRRFQKLEVLPDKFENVWSFDLKKHAVESFGAFHSKPEKVELVFDSLLENYLHDHPLHAGQKVRRRDGLLLVRLNVGINESLIHRLLGFGTMVRVLAPSRLAEMISSRHRAAAEMYTIPPPDEPSAPTLPLKFE